MPIARFALVLLAVLPFSRSAAAQARSFAGQGRLTGIVRDSSTGLPVPRVRVVARGGITWTDSAGRYSFHTEPGARDVRFFCPSATLFFPRRLPGARVEIRADSTTTLDVRIDVGACAEPRRGSVEGEFAGHLVAEFEHVDFVPCPGTVKRRWRPIRAKRIWVNFTRATRKTGPKRWPATDTGKPGGRRFVRWKGRLTGPGDYGHLGMAQYQLTVTEIREIRTPGPGDCG